MVLKISLSNTCCFRFQRSNPKTRPKSARPTSGRQESFGGTRVLPLSHVVGGPQDHPAAIPVEVLQQITITVQGPQGLIQCVYGYMSYVSYDIYIYIVYFIYVIYTYLYIYIYVCHIYVIYVSYMCIYCGRFLRDCVHVF